MRKINTTKMLCAVAGLAFCSQTMAQTDLHDSIDLHEVQIVGKTKARKMHEQAYAISVVDLATKYQSASALNQVLNTVTSIKIREDGGLGSNYSFAMNGFSGNQVKFFIDGIPMDNFGSSFNLANISANMGRIFTHSPHAERQMAIHEPTAKAFQKYSGVPSHTSCMIAMIAAMTARMALTIQKYFFITVLFMVRIRI